MGAPSEKSATVNVSPVTLWSFTMQFWSRCDMSGTRSFFVTHWFTVIGGIGNGMPTISIFIVTSQLPSCMAGSATPGVVAAIAVHSKRALARVVRLMRLLSRTWYFNIA